MLLSDKVSQFATDSDKVRAWVNGPASGIGSSIDTATGLVRTPAKLIADKDTEITLALQLLLNGDFSALPTSSAGLSAGLLWVDAAAGNTLKRVP